jgi:hypothetical protein
MLRHVPRVLEYLDIRRADLMGLFACYWSELHEIVARLDAERCSPYVVADAGRTWTRLVAMSHTFEECWHEWFLPT